MKARLLNSQDQIQLLLCTGKIIILQPEAAREFLLSYSDSRHYEGNETWDTEFVTMEEYSGKTIAYVNDSSNLIVVDNIAFREIMEAKKIKYLTVQQYADRNDRQTAIVRRFCRDGRLPGAFLCGKTWLIPEDAPYPLDARIGKRK